ncbi:uncharacterized protein MELLADRAFT_104516 [Melampsora larici-populina 98AG31]|uniref:Uncharacterized protein n=1 Tax=Melampsora larici-populina (strain 98AG31 / pathotype 3-4-7) TaxID=747676 RepID=F4REY3_MELLP|nr:uncharacterized protein MELLADRAFT_104516 [Melampsora larici-populina 98AG31]EGG09206.1 hypothetical protein MELLADRAFT_104516 [Melampsora larici-populina 98AG31]
MSIEEAYPFVYPAPLAKRVPPGRQTLPESDNNNNNKEMPTITQIIGVRGVVVALPAAHWIPHKFPNALVWDLLQYNYIKLEKINAGVIPNVTNHVSKSKDKDAAAKIKPKPFTESGEWRESLSILWKALSLAFVGLRLEVFSKYFLPSISSSYNFCFFFFALVYFITIIQVKHKQ